MSLINSALAIWLSLNPPSQCVENCTTSEIGLSLIRQFEGYSPFVYKDAVGKPTIGYGHLMLPGEKFAEPLMQGDAEALLKKDIAPRERAVNAMVRVSLHSGQFDALVSFVYNLGGGSLQRSGLLKKVNRAEHESVPPEFEKWAYAGGKKLRGLEIRREAEAMLYKGG